MARRVRAAFGIGSNVGDGMAHLAAAVAGLRTLGENVVVSPYYSTAPVGGPDQERYLNAVVTVTTRETPGAILEHIHSIERERGRLRRERWGPRTLDIDLLLYGDAVIDEPGLQVPHPRMAERRFVLQPLLDIWPDATLPDGRPLAPMLEQVRDQDVRLVAPEGAGSRTSAAGVFVVVAIAALVLWWLGDWVL